MTNSTCISNRECVVNCSLLYGPISYSICYGTARPASVLRAYYTVRVPIAVLRHHYFHACGIIISSHHQCIRKTIMRTMRITLMFCMYLTCCGALSVSRRHFWTSCGAVVVPICLTTCCRPALAVDTTSQEASDKAKIVKGYQRLTYLLDNWEKETTICGRGDNPYIGCERTPLKVMEVIRASVCIHFLKLQKINSQMMIPCDSTWDIEMSMIHCLKWKRR
jgi:hypothetical protein